MTQVSPPPVSDKQNDTAADRSASVRDVLKRGVGFYKLVAIILTNTIITLIVVNVFSAIVNKIWDTKIQHEKNRLIQSLFAEKYHDYTAPQLREILKENTRERIYEYAPYVGYKQRAASLKYMHITAPGFRWSTDNGPWPPSANNLNVFVYGASTTFGDRVTDDETIPSQLQQYLKGKSDKPVKVYNFGTPSYFSTLERIQFANMLAQGLVPDLAVFIDGNLDALSYTDDPPFSGEVRELMEDRGYGLLKASRPFFCELPMTKLVNRLRGSLTKKKGQSNKIVFNQAQVDHIIARYTANKNLIEVQAREFGVNTLFVWQPCSTYHCDPKCNPFPEPDVPHADRVPTYERMAEKVKANSPELSKNFLWLADIQQGITEPCYVDIAQHYRASLCKKIASAIGQSLVDRHWLAKETTPSVESAGR